MDTQIRLIGLAGAAGSGKDMAAEIICREFGAENLSTGDLIRTITRHIYRLPPDFNPVRDQLFEVATFIRNEIDPATTVKLCILQAKELKIELALLSGLRTVGEAQALQAAGGVIIGIDADPKVRYERIYSRKRDTESNKTYEQFLVQDAFENDGVSDSGAGRGIRHVVAAADVVITNNDSLEAFEMAVKTTLSDILKR